MSVFIVKESGSGKPDANTYADAVDGDTYFAGHLYAAAWEAATLERKNAALVMATRLIDSLYQFRGIKRREQQSLQWPRMQSPDPDNGGFLPHDAVPKGVFEATCEMARELLILDRTAAPPGEGLKYENLGPNQLGFSKDDVRPIISHVAQAMLAKYGVSVKKKSGSVPLVRT
ncbi:MAG: DnaT-like ssDNA-binding protein [Limisphaerales bacterium]